MVSSPVGRSGPPYSARFLDGASATTGFEGERDIGHDIGWPVVSSPDATWEAPYSARFLDGASAPGS